MLARECRGHPPMPPELPAFSWSLRHGPCPSGGAAARAIAPFCLWGIVNVTPDSFYDGGRYADPSLAVAHGLQLAEEGAAVLDVGGASSRPGALDVPAGEEAARVVPVVRALAEARAARPERNFAISADTWRADVARAALEAGADIINDISACAWDPALPGVLAEYRPGYVLMHCNGRPATMQDAARREAKAGGDIATVVADFLGDAMRSLIRAGLPEDRIILDPGVGFGKTGERSAALLSGIGKLLDLGRPVLIGLSQKSLFGDALGLAPGERGEATNIATALLAARGALHHRVHNVAAARRALALVKCLGPFGAGRGDMV